jgi:hypothetical protein
VSRWRISAFQVSFRRTIEKMMSFNTKVSDGKNLCWNSRSKASTQRKIMLILNCHQRKCAIWAENVPSHIPCRARSAWSIRFTRYHALPRVMCMIVLYDRGHVRSVRNRQPINYARCAQPAAHMPAVVKHYPACHLLPCVVTPEPNTLRARHCTLYRVGGKLCNQLLFCLNHFLFEIALFIPLS